MRVDLRQVFPKVSQVSPRLTLEHFHLRSCVSTLSLSFSPKLFPASLMATLLLDGEQLQDFSSNAHSPQVDAHGRFEASYEVPNRHPELSFEDGNLAVLCGHRYFLVHRSVLFRHSTVLAEMAESPAKEDMSQSLEGRSILRLSQPPDEVYILLKHLYG